VQRETKTQRITAWPVRSGVGRGSGSLFASPLSSMLPSQTTLPAWTKGNAFVGFIRHAPATAPPSLPKPSTAASSLSTIRPLVGVRRATSLSEGYVAPSLSATARGLVPAAGGEECGDVCVICLNRLPLAEEDESLPSSSFSSAAACAASTPTELRVSKTECSFLLLFRCWPYSMTRMFRVLLCGWSKGDITSVFVRFLPPLRVFFLPFSFGRNFRAGTCFTEDASTAGCCPSTNAGAALATTQGGRQHVYLWFEETEDKKT